MASKREFSISDPPKYADLIEVAEKISAKLSDRTELIKFGLELLDEETAKRVKRDCADKSLRDLCLELLEKWQSSRDEPTWDDVVEALRTINQRELAKLIEDAKQQPSTQEVRKQPGSKRPTLKEEGEPVSKKVKSTAETDEVVRTPTNILDSEPTLPDLLERFKGVADWDAVCPHLLNDTTGQKTKEIKRNHMDVNGRRTEMLEQYLKESNPTWRGIVSALRKGNYNNLADQIVKDLQG